MLEGLQFQGGIASHSQTSKRSSPACIKGSAVGVGNQQFPTSLLQFIERTFVTTETHTEMPSPGPGTIKMG